MPYELSEAISFAYRQDEEQCVTHLLEQLSFSEEALGRIQNTAQKLIKKIRTSRLKNGGIDAFMQTYDLSSDEGIALMCLAEALLRIPDNETRDRLIKDKLSTQNWQQYLDKETSLFVNAATLGLFLTGKVFSRKSSGDGYWGGIFKQLMGRLGEPVIRTIINKMMGVLGRHFVMSETIEKALEKSKKKEKEGYLFSYDMLGEAAKTAIDAKFYFHSYLSAIEAIAKKSTKTGPFKAPGISVKLSALYPRYEWAKKDRVLAELYPLLKELAYRAKQVDIHLTIDAEEAERLELSLLLFEKLALDPDLKEWQGLGLAVQSYQKRASAVIDWLIQLARQQKRRFMVRLVKGAYWDSEIKWAQERGLKDYPVFTRKTSTDVSYLVCAKKILAATDAIYPQFATHNAFTVAAVLEMANHYRDFEFQCLHGMGNFLYDHIVGDSVDALPCRIYAPVGSYEHLLAYLVRRLLENGANSSFVNQIVDEKFSLEEIITDPFIQTKKLSEIRHSKIPLPRNLYAPDRKNSIGIDFSDSVEIKLLYEKMANNIEMASNLLSKLKDPLSKNEILDCLVKSQRAFYEWDQKPVSIRANCLRELADILQENQADLMALLVREAGKTLPDAASELREAIDFCGYYAFRAEEDFKIKTLVGPTGERDQLKLQGRGVIVCISPWNFPLAIFLGQILAALAAGNAVIAKPASQTTVIAEKVIALLGTAGFPKDLVQLCITSGDRVSTVLLPDSRVQGVMFTGSTETATHINRVLAAREGSIIPLIAETGGQNTLIVDSSALPEQVVSDAVVSAFNSAGQRCSALRVMFIQADVADRILTMLKGAMAELTIGDPLDLGTDIGPVIDHHAAMSLEKHLARMKNDGKLLYECPLPSHLPILPRGAFFAPRLIEIDHISVLKEEVFGPVLHVIRYQAKDLDRILSEINQTGYGLTLGIHSRIDSLVAYIGERVRVGNIYVNRNMIGAVVGVQPFGGEGLSGTGPKAGGPHLLPRLAVERTLSVNLSASGGNVTLMSLQD